MTMISRSLDLNPTVSRTWSPSSGSEWDQILQPVLWVNDVFMNMRLVLVQCRWWWGCDLPHEDFQALDVTFGSFSCGKEFYVSANRHINISVSHNTWADTRPDRSTGSRQDSEQNLNKRQVQHVNMSADRLHLFLMTFYRRHQNKHNQ